MSTLPSERRAVGAVTPSLSVVVLTAGDPSHLRDWLAGISPACGPLGAQIVVCGPSAGLEEEFGSVSFVAPPRAAADPAALRREGMRRAGGDIVLFTDDGATDVAERLASLVSACGCRPPSSPDR